MGFLYYIGLGISLGLIIYQYSLIYDRNPAHCFKAFLHNNWVGGTIFLVLCSITLQEQSYKCDSNAI